LGYLYYVDFEYSQYPAIKTTITDANNDSNNDNNNDSNSNDSSNYLD
jgi:hypothetical protein